MDSIMDTVSIGDIYTYSFREGDYQTKVHYKCPRSAVTEFDYLLPFEFRDAIWRTDMTGAPHRNIVNTMYDLACGAYAFDKRAPIWDNPCA